MKQYNVYECRVMLAQRGECYEEMRENENAELIPEEFDNLEDAHAFLSKVVSSWDSDYEIVRTKRGLDTIVYNTAWIEVEEYADDDPTFPIDYKDIEYVSSLPDSVLDAAMKHQREYWSYLDYEQDYYAPIKA